MNVEWRKEIVEGKQKKNKTERTYVYGVFLLLNSEPPILRHKYCYNGNLSSMDMYTIMTLLSHTVIWISAMVSRQKNRIPPRTAYIPLQYIYCVLYKYYWLHQLLLCLKDRTAVILNAYIIPLLTMTVHIIITVHLYCPRYGDWVTSGGQIRKGRLN